MATFDPSGQELQEIKASMRTAWTAGDFGVIARTIAGSGKAFVSRLNIPSGARVLDVACGSGNLAVPLARKGCVVTGLDIAPNLLEQARARAKAEHLEARFDEGDAEQMPYDSGSFEAVVSMFGAMFAPRPEVVAAELARVLQPGGLLAMANWNAESFSGRMFSVHSRHAASPPGVPPSVLWGDEATVRARLAKDFVGVTTELIPVDFDLPVNPAGAVMFFRTYFGPAKTAFDRLDAPGQAALENDLVELWTGANIAPDPEKHTLVRNESLQVVATRI